MLTSFRNASSQRGVGMVEVMVSLLLLGIAVIGFAALQVRAVAVTGDSAYRTQAMGIAQELAEKMRANFTQLTGYTTAANWATAVIPDCMTAACTAAQLQTYDIQNTMALAANLLPGGTVMASTCNGSSNTCIYVAWNRTTTAVDGSANSCVGSTGVYTSTSADCIVMEIY